MLKRLICSLLVLFSVGSLLADNLKEDRRRAENGFKAKPFGKQILVYEVESDGPAAKAGLEKENQIVGVNNLNAVRAFERLSVP
jgi:predicted metalloprotease with PDZ domain